MIRRPPDSLLLPSGHTDLASTINETGRLLFDAEWTGDELDYPYPWCSELELDSRAKNWIASDPKIAEKVSLPSGLDDEDAVRDAVIAHIRASDQKLHPARVRRDEATASLRQQFYEGGLKACAIAMDGTLHPISTQFWAGTNALHIFDTGVVFIVGDGISAERSRPIIVGDRRRTNRSRPSDETGFVLVAGSPNTANHVDSARRERLTAAHERACREWLAEHMAKSPSLKIRTKQYWKEQADANSNFRVSGRGFLRAWDAAIQDSGAYAWSDSGAPKGPRK